MFKHLLSLLCVILLLLCMSTVLRKTDIKEKCPFLKNVYKYHQYYAWLLIIFSLIHGIVAGQTQAMISGKIVWMILLILTLLAYMQKQISYKSWRFTHRVLSIIVCVGIVVHIIIAILY